MYQRILSNINLPLKDRVKNLYAYWSKRRGGRITWRKRFSKIFELHPDYNEPVGKRLETEHKTYWGYFSKKCNLSTLRVSKGISDNVSHKIIPEEIFYSDIEPTLNTTPSVEFLTYKSFYNQWFPGNIFPKDYFHNVEEVWLDQNLNAISFDNVCLIAQELNYPVTFKPNRDSYGGKDVFFPSSSSELIQLMQKRKNFVVQEKIEQHSFFNQFNKKGLNTIRVCLYRSVINNETSIINAALRMGVGGSLDNETAGGIVTFVKKTGELNGFAVDKHGGKFFEHPDSKVPFIGVIPDFSGLELLSKIVARRIFYSRVFSLDFCLDNKGNWRVIEINLFGQTIRFAQYAGQPFFGEFSDEVVNYCKNNHWALK